MALLTRRDETPARTDTAGLPPAISGARFGPDRTSGSRRDRRDSSRQTSTPSRPVPRSMPFVAMTTGLVQPASHTSRATGRRAPDGTATITAAALVTASAIDVPAIMLEGRRSPPQARELTWYLVISSAVVPSSTTSDTRWHAEAWSHDSVMPQAPSPMTAISTMPMRCAKSRHSDSRSPIEKGSRPWRRPSAPRESSLLAIHRSPSTWRRSRRCRA